MSIEIRVHPDIDKQAKRLNLEKKIDWVLTQLGIDGGKNLIVKSIAGQHKFNWKRTPVKGNQFYLWWLKESGECIFARDIRHHDDNDTPLPHNLNEYKPRLLNDLDPRTDDQKKVADFAPEKNFHIRVVQGAPGCGKTVSLLYAARDIFFRNRVSSNKILYITFTDKLAEWAKSFFKAHGANEEQVQVVTVQQLQDALLGRRSFIEAVDKLKQSKEDFLDYLKSYPWDLTAWKNERELLWTELRGYLFGMALPQKWERQVNDNILLIPYSENGILDKNSYQKIRAQLLAETCNPYLENSLGQAWNLANNLLKNNKAESLFPDQRQSYQILKQIIEENKTWGWIKEKNAIIVDEIQDFTIMEIALIAHLARLAIDDNKPFYIILTGDEAQTLFPSGFDWGLTKDVIRQIVDQNPDEAEPLTEQKRSPKCLTSLIENVNNLYKLAGIPKPIKPQASKKISVNPEDEKNGVILRCRISNDEEQLLFFEKLVPFMSRTALIDINGKLENTIKNLSDDKLKDNIKAILFTPSEIKGLERNIIFVAGLPETIANLQNNRQKNNSSSWQIGVLRNRYLVDKVRVALSRSNHVLVIVEDQKPPIDNYRALSSLDGIQPISVEEVFKEISALVYDKIDVYDKFNELLKIASEHIDNKRYDDAETVLQKAEETLETLPDKHNAQEEFEQAKQNLFTERTKDEIYRLLSNSQGKVDKKQFDSARQLVQKAEDIFEKRKDSISADVENEIRDSIDSQGREIVRAEKKSQIEILLAQTAKVNVDIQTLPSVIDSLIKVKNLLDELESGGDLDSLISKFESQINKIYQNVLEPQFYNVEGIIKKREFNKAENGIERVCMILKELERLKPDERTEQFQERYNNKLIYPYLVQVKSFLNPNREEFSQAENLLEIVKRLFSKYPGNQTNQKNYNRLRKEFGQKIDVFKIKILEHYEYCDRLCQDNHFIEAKKELKKTEPLLLKLHGVTIKYNEKQYLHQYQQYKKKIKDGIRDQIKESFQQLECNRAIDIYNQTRKNLHPEYRTELENDINKFLKDNGYDRPLWENARKRTSEKSWYDVVKTYRLLSDIRKFEDNDAYKLYDLLAERYFRLPTIDHAKGKVNEQIDSLMKFIESYVTILKNKNVIKSEETTRKIFNEWKMEIEHQLQHLTPAKRKEIEKELKNFEKALALGLTNNQRTGK